MNGVVRQNTHKKLNIKEFRAFTLIDDYAPLIFINSNDSQNGKLFSLLHEAVHIWLGISNFYNDDNSIHAGRTHFTDVYRLTNTNRKTFSKIVDIVRGIDV